jgi:hypothetical protein
MQGAAKRRILEYSSERRRSRRPGSARLARSGYAQQAPSQGHAPAQLLLGRRGRPSESAQGQPHHRAPVLQEQEQGRRRARPPQHQGPHRRGRIPVGRGAAEGPESEPAQRGSLPVDWRVPLDRRERDRRGEGPLPVASAPRRPRQTPTTSPRDCGTDSPPLALRARWSARKTEPSLAVGQRAAQVPTLLPRCPLTIPSTSPVRPSCRGWPGG